MGKVPSNTRPQPPTNRVYRKTASHFYAVVGNVIQGVPWHFHDLESIPKNRDLSPSSLSRQCPDFGVIGTNNWQPVALFSALTPPVWSRVVGNYDGIERQALLLKSLSTGAGSPSQRPRLPS